MKLSCTGLPLISLLLAPLACGGAVTFVAENGDGDAGRPALDASVTPDASTVISNPPVDAGQDATPPTTPAWTACPPVTWPSTDTSVPEDAAVPISLAPMALSGNLVEGSRPLGIVAAGGAVYWMDSYTDQAGTNVLSVPVSGGSPTTLASGEQWSLMFDVQIVVRPEGVYWVNDRRDGSGDIMTVPLDGGPAVTLVSGQAAPHNLQVDCANMYWTATTGTLPEGTGRVMRAPVTGGAATPFGSGSVVCNELELNADSLYCAYTEGGGDAGTISRLPLNGDPPTTLVSGLGLVNAVTLDATNLYFATGDDAWSATGKFDYPLRSVPLAGGPTTTIFTASDSPRIVVSDSTFIYWTQTSPGFVMKAPVSGGAVQTLASGGGQPTAFVGLGVDSTGVYWASDNDTIDRGTLMRLPSR